MRAYAVKKWIPLLAVLICIFSGSLFAKPKEIKFEKQDVRYAGFAFVGQFKDIPLNYRYTKKLFDESINQNGSSVFDTAFLKLLKDVDKSDLGFNLVIGQETDSTIAMALVAERESVSIVKISEYYKIVVNLLCDVAFLNFDNLQLAGIFPIYLEYIDLKKNTPPDDQYISDLIRRIYFTDSSSIFNMLKERLKNIAPRKDARLSIRVNNVSLGDNLNEFINQNNITNLDAFKSNIANRFTDALSSKLNIAVLPYTKDHMGGKMSLAFSDAKVHDFTIPDASYSSDVSINKFTKQIYKETPAERAYLYGIFGKVKVYEPESARTYFDSDIKSGAVKVVPIANEALDEYAIYDDILDVFTGDTSKTMLKDKSFSKEVLKRCANK